MPYLPNERQYRDFSVSSFQPIEKELSDGCGDDDDKRECSYVVRGHYTVFDTEYELFPGFYESIAPTALDEMDTSDVLFQFNHGGTPLARLRNHSLRIGIDELGGWAEADLSGCQQARDTYEAISNGLIDRMSFGFTIADDGFEWYEDEDGSIHSRITKVSKLFDVSCVDLPANDGTDISARSYVDAAIEAQRLAEEQRIAEQQAAEAAEAAELAGREQARSRRMRRARAMRLSSI